MPDKKAQVEAEELFIDLFKREQAQDGIFFDVDMAQYTTAIENLTREESPENREKWELGFDIDFKVKYKRTGAGDDEWTEVAHEVKSFDRTLGQAIKEQYQWDFFDKKRKWVKMYNRGIIPLEIVGDMRKLIKGREWHPTDPDTGKQTTATAGASWVFKNHNKKANWFHFYLPIGSLNEGRIEASEEEKAYMQEHTKQGAKLVVEAPAGLYISMTRDVLDAFAEIALNGMAQVWDNIETFEDRRAILEEFSKEGQRGQVVEGVNVRTHITKLLEAQEKARQSGGKARLEARPVFRFIRNGCGNDIEPEVAISGREYYMPQRLRNIYFNEYGQSKRTIQGYWTDTPVLGRALSDMIALYIQDTHSIDMAEGENIEQEAQE